MWILWSMNFKNGGIIFMDFLGIEVDFRIILMG